MSKNLSQTPKTAANVEKITKTRLESKNYDETYNAKDREVSQDKNLNLPSTTSIDTHIITVKRDSIHPVNKTCNLPDAKNGLESSIKFEKYYWCNNKSSLCYPPWSATSTRWRQSQTRYTRKITTIRNHQ